MLVLTRKSGQKLMIGNDIVVTVLETRGDTVKIGIEAPKNVSIYREELFEEIRQANQQSQSSQTDASQLSQMARFAKPKGGWKKPQ